MNSRQRRKLRRIERRETRKIAAKYPWMTSTIRPEIRERLLATRNRIGTTAWRREYLGEWVPKVLPPPRPSFQCQCQVCVDRRWAEAEKRWPGVPMTAEVEFIVDEPRPKGEPA